MAKRNALMEWVSQTRKLAKAHDYSAAALVDRIYDILPYINPSILVRHREFVTDICKRYHKPDPLYEIKDRRKRKAFFEGLDRRIAKPRPRCKMTKGCPTVNGRSVAINKFLEAMLVAYEEAGKNLVWQWYEIIDIMYERPELIDPAIVKDDYIVERVAYVCGKHRKNNPLLDGTARLFGKYWIDPKGKLRHERRQRF